MANLGKCRVIKNHFAEGGFMGVGLFWKNLIGGPWVEWRCGRWDDVDKPTPLSKSVKRMLSRLSKNILNGFFKKSVTLV